jgi:hypothetical protein
MITHHVKLARVPAEQPGLPGRVHEAIGTVYEQWGGRGWSGVLEAGAVPVAARIVPLAGFMEVAHREPSTPTSQCVSPGRPGRRRKPPRKRAPKSAPAAWKAGRRCRDRGGRPLPAAPPGRPRGPDCPREVEVLILVASGMYGKQIAERLVITPKTAGNHVEHIYAEIDASSRGCRGHVRGPARPAPPGRRSA